MRDRNAVTIYDTETHETVTELDFGEESV